MDEVWRSLPGQREASVHLALFPSALADWQDDGLLERWAQLSSVRDHVNVALEEQRQQKVIAASLSARVSIGAAGSLAELLQQYREELPAIFGVSQVVLEAAPPEQPGVVVSVHRADGIKCERCWRYVPSVSDAGEFKGLCERCVDALSQPLLGRAS
jgi:isoleucyl-tRNA synthetase